MARTPVRRAEKVCDIELFPRVPCRESGRREQRVQREHQRKSIFGGEKRLNVQDPDFVKRRLLDFRDDRPEIEVISGLPFVGENCAKEGAFAAFCRIHIDRKQPEQAGDSGQHALRQRLVIGLVLRGVKGIHEIHRQARRASRCVDGKIRLLLHRADPRAILPPGSEAVSPQLRLTRRPVIRRHPLAHGVVLNNPGTKILRFQIGKCQQQIGEVALGINNDSRHAIDSRLFEQREAEPGFSAARHPDADGMGHQIARVVKQRLVGTSIDRLSQIERAEFFKIRRGRRHDGDVCENSRHLPAECA